MSREEKRVLRELQQGKNLEKNYRWLFDRYYKRVIYFFGYQGSSREESCDLAQDTFIAVIKNIKKFKGECSFKTWFLHIAFNIRSNKARSESAAKRIKTPVSLEALGDSPCTALYQDAADPGPENRYLAKEAAQRLREEVRLLPRQIRSCVLLRVYQALKYREIAVVLKISIDTVKSHLYQAKEKLKEKLGEYVDTINLEEGEDDG